MFDTFEAIETLRKRRLVSCNECKRKSIHEALSSYRGRWDVRGGPGGGGEFHLFKCGGCDAVIFISEEWDDDDHFIDHDGEPDVFLTVKQYPPITSSLTDVDTSDCPSKIRQIIQEAASSLDNNNLLSATILARMTIEEICNDLGLKGGNLKQKIDNLCKDLAIEDSQKELIHEIRLRGNDGAHETKPMSASEVKAGFEILALVIDKRYSAPARATRAIENARRQLKIKP